MDEYIVYVRTNTKGYIIAINSSAFLGDTEGWTEIEHGTGDRYHHAQGNYLDKPIMTQSGVYQYKMVDGSPVECTPEEIAQQEADLPQPEPSDTEARIKALEEELAAAKIILGVE